MHNLLTVMYIEIIIVIRTVLNCTYCLLYSVYMSNTCRWELFIGDDLTVPSKHGQSFVVLEMYRTYPNKQHILKTVRKGVILIFSRLMYMYNDVSEQGIQHCLGCNKDYKAFMVIINKLGYICLEYELNYIRLHSGIKPF